MAVLHKVAKQWPHNPEDRVVVDQAVWLVLLEMLVDILHLKAIQEAQVITVLVAEL